MSLRAALGAARGRIVRQLLTESVLLAAMGGVAGACGRVCGDADVAGAGVSGEGNVPIGASPSGVVVWFAIGLSLVTGIVFGVAPAWIASRAEPADALRSGVRTTSAGSSRLQKGLVALQAAPSFVLLVGAGLRCARRRRRCRTRGLR